MVFAAPSATRRYALSAVLVVGAVALRFALDPLLGQGYPFATIVLAVLVAAGYGGLGPGLVAAVLGAILGAWLLFLPRGTFALDTAANQGSLAVYLAVAVGVAALGGSLRRAREQARTALAEVTAQREELRQTLARLGVVFRDSAEPERAEAARRHLAAIVESSADAIYSKDLDGVVTSWNGAAERLFGYTAAEVLGKSFTILVPPDRADEAAELMARIRQGDRVEHFETVRRRNDGELIDVSVSYSPVRDAAGRLVGAAVITRDISVQKQALAALKASEARFAAVIQNAPAVVFVKDADGVYLMANPQFVAYAGRPIEAILGKTDTDLFSPDVAARLRARDQSVIAGGHVQAFEESFEAGGSGSTYLTARFPLPDAAGRPAAVCGIATDITDRKRGEIASRFLAGASSVLAALTDVESALQNVATLAVPDFADWCAVDMAEPDGAIRRVAVAHVEPEKVRFAHELHRRLPHDPAAPTGVPQIIRSGRSEIVPDITDQMLAAALGDPDLLRIARELGLRSYIGVPLTVRGKTLGAVTFIAAESGRRYDEADLAAAEDLARRAAVAVENAQLYQAVREADQRKDEFLATLAHELRNPLAPIRNALHLLKSDTADDSVRALANEMMGRQVHMLVRLVDDLLDVSRVMRGKVDLRKEPVDVSTAIARAVETAQPLIDARGHTLTVSAPPGPVHVEADPVRLAQIVGNLLTNAAKYTDAGGRIDLALEEAGGDAVVRVRDSGIGIAPDMLPKVFDLFVQVATTADRSEGGLGIGLTLVKRLVELHGGTVDVLSAGPGRGTEFVVRLPLLHPTEPSPSMNGTALGHADRPASRRILVVDDHPDAADSLAMMLRIEGHDVRVARNGPDALAEVRADRPEIVLLDLGMPGMDGFEVARRLRHDGGRDVLLVALSGWGQESDRQRTRQAGFDHHLVKPADPDDLRAVLASPNRA